jgi:AcrR family transcriptional regulator
MYASQADTIAIVLPRTQRERSRTTTARLVEAARPLFAADGFAGTLLDDVVRRAGVTKGALYHHFPGKRELFEAVFEHEQEQLAAVAVAAYRRRRDHWPGFEDACRAYLEASLDPGVQRITLLDAPSVLGWERLREIEDRHTGAQLRAGLERAVEEGVIARRPVEPLVQMLNGALCEAAMLVARSSNQRATMRDVMRELRQWLAALAAHP